MRALAAALLAAAAFLFPLAAQDAGALTAREDKLIAKAVPALHALADALQAQRQHLRALGLRQSIWLDYAENDDKAREKCGFVKVGDLWRKDVARLVLDKNLTPDAKAMKKIEQDWQNLKKDLLAEHRALGAGWQQAGDAARAGRHWRRVLDLQPGDKEAASALALQGFEGFAGSATELAMLRRARTIRTACDWLNRTAFPVADEAGKHALLTAAKVEHIGVRSEHFAVWGNLPPADLRQIAADCERALLLAHTLLGTWRGSVFVPARRRDMVFVHQPAQYAAILDQCASQFEAARLQFLKGEVDQAFVEHGGRQLRLHKAHLGIEASRDQAVRGVVQDAVGVYTEGLYEGLGHAACGFLFGRTLTFLVEQQKAKTVASFQPRMLAPDMATWMKIAEESAWAKSDTRTSELVLLSAARFTTEQRVKAWAMCHYLMHWRPDLLHQLDQSQNKDIRTPPEVETEFMRRTTVDLRKVDHDWREFWGRGGELRKAMAAEVVPADEKAPDRAPKLRARSVVDAVNAARAAAMRGPAGFFVTASADVATAIKFDEQLGKAEAERSKKPKENIALPAAPACIGRTVLWSRQQEPVAAVAEWLLRPSARDLLLHPGRELFGGSTCPSVCVLDAALPGLPTTTGLPLCWPRDGQRDVPASVAVSALGPRAIAALVAAGKQPSDTVGIPVSLHFARAIDPAVLAKVGCRVWSGNHELVVVPVVYGGGADDGDGADGVVAFVPLVALPAKSRVEVTWELPPGFLGKDETFPIVGFAVQ
ncbi:MAG: hypothetical protein WBO45_23385 [Planctomycetota bacterium]